VSDFQRITTDPAKMGGAPCIRETRIPVTTVVNMVRGGMSHREILEDYPDLDGDDIDEALRYDGQIGASDVDPPAKDWP
jgi:uncharacterized protein (DUF433 family)